MNDSNAFETIVPAGAVRPAVIPDPSRDILTEILHDGAQRLLAQAIDAEVSDWIDRHAEVLDDDGRRQVLRNGHQQPRAAVLLGLPRLLHRQGVPGVPASADAAGPPLVRLSHASR